MVSSASSRGDSQEKKPLLDKPNSSKSKKSARDASNKSSSVDKSENKKRSDQSRKTKSTAESKSSKSTKSKVSKDSSKASERGVRTVTSQKSMTSVQSMGRRGPKMSDGTEFDTGPFGYVFSFIYLAILWGLAIIAAIAIVYFYYSRLDRQFPTYFGEGSFLGGVPKVTFDPNPRRFEENTNRNLMEWNIYDFKSYLNLLIRYKHVLKNYMRNDKNKNQTLCRNETMTTEKACRFDRFTDFGDCVLSEENLEHGFGFSKGQPCIMLKVNKIVGWYPKLKTPNNCTQGDLCCGEGIKFKCESDDDVQFEYYPKNGISPCYFPYANQKEYEQPYQMVKVTNLTFNKETTIECYPTDPSLTEIMEGKRNEARFHIKIKHDTPQ